MTCDEVAVELVAFQLGEVSDEARPALEAHLPGCPACVRAYLEVKRAVEAAEAGPAPSELARRRVRSAVARELGQAPRPRWAVPVALAVAASVVLLAASVVGRVALEEGSAPHALVARGG